jgi:hypothetical protein
VIFTINSIYCTISSIINDEKWYADEVSDTTMLPIAASLPAKNQKNAEGIFIYNPQSLPLRQILKPQLF